MYRALKGFGKMSSPGFEPGLSRPQRDVLTARRRRPRDNISRDRVSRVPALPIRLRLPMRGVQIPYMENRHRRDSNPRGQSPVDFESTSLTTRTQCHCCMLLRVKAGKQSPTTKSNRRCKNEGFAGDRTRDLPHPKRESHH